MQSIKNRFGEFGGVGVGFLIGWCIGSMALGLGECPKGMVGGEGLNEVDSFLA